jgi:hypothetical protein
MTINLLVLLAVAVLFGSLLAAVGIFLNCLVILALLLFRYQLFNFNAQMYPEFKKNLNAQMYVCFIF